LLTPRSPILAALVKDKRGTASRPHFVKVTDSPDDMHAFLRLLRFGTPAVVPLPPAPASPAPTEPELSADGHTEEAEAETETETEVTASSSGETTDGEAVTASEMESNAGGVDSGDDAPPPPAPRVASPAPRDTSSPDPRIASPAPRMSTPSLTAPLATSPSPTPHTPVGASGTAPGVPPDFFPTVAQYDGIQRLALKYNGWYPRAVLDFHVELRAPEIVARVGKHGSRADVFALVRLAHTLHSSFLWAEICDRLRTGWWHEILNPWKLGDEDVAVIGDSVFSLLSILASVSSRPNLFSHLDELCVMYSEGE
jgi:hypothetical protein